MNHYNTISPKLISRFEKATGLTFIDENEANGDVCFANNPDLRSDFKTTFTKRDIKKYILGLSKRKNIIVPKDAKSFWKTGTLGKR